MVMIKKQKKSKHAIGEGLYLDLALSIADSNFCKKYKISKKELERRLTTFSSKNPYKNFPVLDQICYLVSKHTSNISKGKFNIIDIFKTFYNEDKIPCLKEKNARI